MSFARRSCFSSPSSPCGLIAPHKTASLGTVFARKDGDTSEDQAWSCAAGDVCEITYDLEAVQSLEQIRIGKPAGDSFGYSGAT